MEAQAPLLLPTTTVAAAARPTTSPSTANIIARVATVLVVACVSLFAHHEASKGFDIAVVNSAASRGTLAGRRFDVFFVSNGRAARVLHHASRAVEQMLYPDESFPRRRVTCVTVQMAARNLTAGATVAAGVSPGEYVISLSPSLMSAADTVAAVTAVVRRAVARMWLWDGHGAAPAHVLDSAVAYLADGMDDEAAPEDGRCISARFLRHLESRQSGFVARLNRAMRDRWSDGAVDAALGAPARRACAAYRVVLTSQTRIPLNSTSDGAGSRLEMYNVVLSNISVGHFCTIHNGASIGQDGYSDTKDIQKPGDWWIFGCPNK